MNIWKDLEESRTFLFRLVGYLEGLGGITNILLQARWISERTWRNDEHSYFGQMDIWMDLEESQTFIFRLAGYLEGFAGITNIRL
jgi:hypothetical protein